LADPEVVVAVMYPPDWDPPADQLAAYLRDVAAVSPRIRIVDERYTEPGELRQRRGQNPQADLRGEAPELTSRQREVLASAEVVLTQDLPSDVVALAPCLRWVQGVGAGVSQLIAAGLPTSQVRLTTAAGVNAVAISEFVLARMLQIAKRFPEIDRLQVERVWRPSYGSQLAGRHLMVVGLGAIGRRVARLGRAFGMTVTGVRRNAVGGESDPDVDWLLAPSDLGAAVGAADYVVAAVPETAESRDMFDATFSLRCGPARCSSTSAEAAQWSKTTWWLPLPAICVRRLLTSSDRSHCRPTRRYGPFPTFSSHRTAPPRPTSTGPTSSHCSQTIWVDTCAVNPWLTSGPPAGSPARARLPSTGVQSRG
jgi:hypothetical protein